MGRAEKDSGLGGRIPAVIRLINNLRSLIFLFLSTKGRGGSRIFVSFVRCTTKEWRD